ncbi:hypothetical protein [Helicobacter winghamensis]|uniref:hypothetical protein n=1 Tax=Helicobacter winghamensis TaxID=157268 RepID=UPI0018A54C08|nr:hypothetical protein [Helicobacter winghamensis]QOQ97713.1 hypothetical protein A0Z60_06665 [Helicobacter winghamensis]
MSRIVYDSIVLLQSGENAKVGYNHLSYWIPIFLEINVKFSILVRDRILYDKLKSHFELCHIICAPSVVEVEDNIFKFKNLKAIFYLSHHPKNIHLLNFSRFKHIFIGSENSIRDSTLSKVIRAYDAIWLPSQAGVEKMSQISGLSTMEVIKIGKPQLLDLYSVKKKDNLVCVLSNFESLMSFVIMQTIIKYAFNHQLSVDFIITSKKTYALKAFYRKLDGLLAINAVECRVHRKMENAIFAGCQGLVCDLRTYREKFLMLNAPIYTYIPNEAFMQDFLKDKYISLDGLYLFSDLNRFEMFLNEGDFKKQEREAFAEYWIGKSYILNKTFEKLLRAIE